MPILIPTILTEDYARKVYAQVIESKIYEKRNFLGIKVSPQRYTAEVLLRPLNLRTSHGLRTAIKIFASYKMDVERGLTVQAQKAEQYAAENEKPSKMLDKISRAYFIQLMDRVELCGLELFFEALKGNDELEAVL